jgi:hypothetical protein
MINIIYYFTHVFQHKYSADVEGQSWDNARQLGKRTLGGPFAQALPPVYESAPYPFPSSVPFTAVSSRVQLSTRSAMVSRRRWAAAG